MHMVLFDFLGVTLSTVLWLFEREEKKVVQSTFKAFILFEMLLMYSESYIYKWKTRFLHQLSHHVHINLG